MLCVLLYGCLVTLGLTSRWRPIAVRAVQTSPPHSYTHSHTTQVTRTQHIHK